MAGFVGPDTQSFAETARSWLEMVLGCTSKNRKHLTFHSLRRAPYTDADLVQELGTNLSHLSNCKKPFREVIRVDQLLFSLALG